MKNLKDSFIRLNKLNRLYHLDKPIIAITGGIASGKSCVTDIVRSEGLQVIDADKLVKTIYETKEAKDFIRFNVPDAWNGKIDFKKLRELVFSEKNLKSRVEDFIYSRLPHMFQNEAQKITNQNFYIYDVPLLFEKKLESFMDLNILVYTPRDTQLKRIIERDDCTLEVANRILDQQMDIEEKKLKADIVIDNNDSLIELAAKVKSLLLQIII